MKVRRHPWVAAAVLLVVLLGLTGTARAVATSRAAAHIPTAAAAPAALPLAEPVAPTSTPEAPPVPSSTEQVVAAERSVDALDAANATSQLGAAVLDRATGQLETGENGATPFYSASVVKLYTVVAILHRVETGAVALDAATTTRIQRALSYSDDNAMNALWGTFGGSATVSQTIALVGLTDSSPPSDPSQWGETKISARDVVAVYNYVLTSMQASSRDMIMNALRNAQDKGADGFNQAFGLLSPPRADGVAAKQGWMWYGSSFYLHSTGVLGPDQRFVVAVLSKNAASAGQNAAAALVSKATAGVESALADA